MGERQLHSYFLIEEVNSNYSWHCCGDAADLHPKLRLSKESPLSKKNLKEALFLIKDINFNSNVEAENLYSSLRGALLCCRSISDH